MMSGVTEQRQLFILCRADGKLTVPLPTAEAALLERCFADADTDVPRDEQAEAALATVLLGHLLQLQVSVGLCPKSGS